MNEPVTEVLQSRIELAMRNLCALLATPERVVFVSVEIVEGRFAERTHAADAFLVRGGVVDVL